MQSWENLRCFLAFLCKLRVMWETEDANSCIQLPPGHTYVRNFCFYMDRRVRLIFCLNEKPDQLQWRWRSRSLVLSSKNLCISQLKKVKVTALVRVHRFECTMLHCMCFWSVSRQRGFELPWFSLGDNFTDRNIDTVIGLDIFRFLHIAMGFLITLLDSLLHGSCQQTSNDHFYPTVKDQDHRK